MSDPIKIELAKQAIKNGQTRGRFMADNTNSKSTFEQYQEWSDAYSEAIHQLTGN